MNRGIRIRFGITRVLIAVAILLVATHAVALTTGEVKPGETLDIEQVRGPGDVKEGYSSSDYESASKSLLERRGFDKI